MAGGGGVLMAWVAWSRRGHLLAQTHGNLFQTKCTQTRTYGCPSLVLRVLLVDTVPVPVPVWYSHPSSCVLALMHAVEAAHCVFSIFGQPLYRDCRLPEADVNQSRPILQKHEWPLKSLCSIPPLAHRHRSLWFYMCTLKQIQRPGSARIGNTSYSRALLIHSRLHTLIMVGVHV